MRQPQVIILEGPDGAGKSTLADCLQQMTVYDSVHLSAPVNETAYELCTRHLSAVLETGNHTIFDRFHVSEPIYGPVARGYDTMCDGYDAIENTLWLSTRPVLVLCMPPYTHAYKNWVKRAAKGGEMLVKSEQFSRVYEGYEKAHRRTSLPVLTYDYTKFSEPGEAALDLVFRLRQMGAPL